MKSFIMIGEIRYIYGKQLCSLLSEWKKKLTRFTWLSCMPGLDCSFGLLVWITCSEHENMENIYMLLRIHVDSIGRGAHSGTEYEARMAESIGHNYILWIWSRVELVRFSFTLDGWTRNVCLLVENGKWKLKIEVCWLIGWTI